MSDIQAGITAFDSMQYLESGEDFGRAAALVLFGRNANSVDTMSAQGYNSYLTLGGYSSALGMCDQGMQMMYSVAETFGEDFFGGFTKIFENEREVSSTMDAAFLLH